jgi:hypothetical protein
MNLTDLAKQNGTKTYMRLNSELDNLRQNSPSRQGAGGRPRGPRHHSRCSRRWRWRCGPQKKMSWSCLWICVLRGVGGDGWGRRPVGWWSGGGRRWGRRRPLCRALKRMGKWRPPELEDAVLPRWRKGVGLRDVRVTPHEREHRGWGNDSGAPGPSLAPPTSGSGGWAAGLDGWRRWNRGRKKGRVVVKSESGRQDWGGGVGIGRLVGEIEQLKLQYNGMDGWDCRMAERQTILTFLISSIDYKSSYVWLNFNIYLDVSIFIS